METAKESGTAADTKARGEQPPDVVHRVIKRYSNRKLYDTRDSRYVTLQQIGEMVRAGEDVQIIDNATKEDKTEVTLALIISEDLKSQPRSVPLGTLRNLIQERGEKLLSSLREGPIGRLIPNKPGEEGELIEAPPAAAAPPAPVTEAEKATAASKGRFNDLVQTSKQTIEQWQHVVDERIRTILPGMGLVRELQSEVKRLGLRVEELEGKLKATAAPADSAKKE